MLEKLSTNKLIASVLIAVCILANIWMLGTSLIYPMDVYWLVIRIYSLVFMVILPLVLCYIRANYTKRVGAKWAVDIILNSGRHSLVCSYDEFFRIRDGVASSGGYIDIRQGGKDIIIPVADVRELRYMKLTRETQMKEPFMYIFKSPVAVGCNKYIGIVIPLTILAAAGMICNRAGISIGFTNKDIYGEFISARQFVNICFGVGYMAHVVGAVIKLAKEQRRTGNWGDL